MRYFDMIIAGGTVIDGRNLPRVQADVGIRDGKIAKIRRLHAADADVVLDASGMIVAPGFVDLHTHYDAQLFWDPYCSISGWHGVTSVAIGNCGFGFAPAHEVDRTYLMSALSRVEAIPSSCIQSTLPWTWETFPEWMDVLDHQPKGINCLTYVPLNPLLIYVMGLSNAKKRDTNPEELAQIVKLLQNAVEAGACGFSAQVTPQGGGIDVQRDYDGSPFATDVMSKDTILELGKALADYDGTFIQTVFGTADGVDKDRLFLEQLAVESSSAVLFNAIGVVEGRPELHKDALEWIRHCRRRGIPVYGQLITSGAAFTFTFEDWNMFDDSATWREATLGSPAQRLAKFRDPALRQALRDDPARTFPLEGLVILETYSEKFLPAKGLRLQDACRVLGYEDMVDLLIDIVVEDEMKTLVQIPHLNHENDLQDELVVEPYGLWGISDGGAHAKFITLGAYPSESIIEFVRERNLLPLEEAHWRLSALNAQLAGFRGRGTLVEGNAADVIVYDYEGLRLLDEEVVEDLPGREWRRVRRAEGYRYVMVNGQLTMIDGKPTGATPGRLLRRGAG